MTMSDKCELAMRRAGYGNIGRALGLTRQGVHRWVAARHVPTDRVEELAELIGLKPWQIRPDAFSAPERETAS